VATYNLWNINRAWAKRREKMARAIESLAPDVIGVQESRIDPADNQSQIQQLSTAVKG
jgi:hypothetical protein